MGKKNYHTNSQGWVLIPAWKPVIDILEVHFQNYDESPF